MGLLLYCIWYSLYKYICTSMQCVAKDMMLIFKVVWLLFVVWDELTGHMWAGLRCMQERVNAASQPINSVLMTIYFDFAILKWTAFIHRYDICPQRLIISQLHSCISSFQSDYKTWQAHRRGNIGPDYLFLYICSSQNISRCPQWPNHWFWVWHRVEDVHTV